LQQSFQQQWKQHLKQPLLIQLQQAAAAAAHQGALHAVVTAALHP
jgi:hypothetical protein